MNNNAEYGIARNLRGFVDSELRVRITRRAPGLVWCVTADLRDAGTPLVLDAHQVSPETATTTVVRHRDGLVWFG